MIQHDVYWQFKESFATFICISPLFFFYNPCQSRSNRCVKAGGTQSSGRAIEQPHPVIVV